MAGLIQPRTTYLEFETKPGVKPWIFWQSGHQYRLGFKAYVQLDACGRMYSVTWRAKNLPVGLHVRQLEWRVILTSLDGFDVLVPSTGMFGVTNTDGSSALNLLRFEQYQHYGAESRIFTVSSFLKP